MRRRLAGERPNNCRNVSLKRRILLKPDAIATSAIGSEVSWINCLASKTRRVCATATGEAPTCWRNNRRNWRAPTPSPIGEALNIRLIETARLDQRERAGNGVAGAAPERKIG